MTYIAIGKIVAPVMVIALIIAAFFAAKTMIVLACTTASVIPATISFISWKNERGY